MNFSSLLLAGQLSQSLSTTLNQTAQTPFAAPAGPVTIYPAKHGANEFDLRYYGFANDAANLLDRSCPEEYKKVKDNHILQSSFDNITVESNIQPSANGFVNAAVTAYSSHQHLEIRPDDVWLSILSQLNIYVNAHDEELRDMFVAHEGQKSLVIDGGNDDIRGEGQGRTNFGVDWGKFAYKMTELIAENIKDPTLREWILPSFSTTTLLDESVAAMMMMSTMQKYFSYECELTCGIPSVTLLGDKSDWVNLTLRADRLLDFGDEPKQWYRLLRPVLDRFVMSFDKPNAEGTKEFWQKIAHYYNGGSGPTYLSGWITAFCFWDADGKPFQIPDENPSSEPDMWTSDEVLLLDGARYHSVETGDIPPGWASVPVTLNDDGNITDCVLVAGHVGLEVRSSGKDLHGRPGVTGLDTINPISGWWMYETRSEEVLKAEEDAKKAEEERWKAELEAMEKQWEEEEIIRTQKWEAEKEAKGNKEWEEGYGHGEREL